MKTRVYTSWDTKYDTMFDDRVKPRCIFNGDIPHLLRAEDRIVVKDGFCTERVRDVNYNLIDNSQEVTLYTSDLGNSYPTVDFH